MSGEPLVTELDYDRAMSRVLVLMLDDPEPDTEAGRELLALVDLIEVYEREHFPSVFDQQAFNAVFRQ